MLDSDFDDSFEERDGMFGHQLFESNKKSGLKRNTAANGGEPGKPG
jgi:hypothetical protein